MHDNRDRPAGHSPLPPERETTVRTPISSSPPIDDADRPEVVPVQLGLLQDAAGMTLQTRFEQFLEESHASLCATNPANGEPLLEAGKHKTTLTVKVQVVRVSNDSLAFTLDHDVAVKLPRIPGRGQTAQVVKGIGMAARVQRRNLPLFDPLGGQPKPVTRDDFLRGKPA